jgi:hypothetical protein
MMKEQQHEKGFYTFSGDFNYMLKAKKAQADHKKTAQELLEEI